MMEGDEPEKRFVGDGTSSDSWTSCSGWSEISSMETISEDVRMLNLKDEEETEASHDGDSEISTTAATARLRFEVDDLEDMAAECGALSYASVETEEDVNQQRLETASLILRRQGRTTLLHEVAETGNSDSLRVVLEDPGVQVNAQEGLGFTALMLSCWKGHTDNVKMLLLNGADVLICTREGVTCLHMAAFCGHKEVVNLLLDDQLQDFSSERCLTLIGKKTTDKLTALHMAASGSHDQGAAIAASILRAFRRSLLNIQGLDSFPEMAYGINDAMWLNFLLEVRNQIQLQEGKILRDVLLQNFVVYGNLGAGSELKERLNEKYEGLVQTYVELVVFSNSKDVSGSTALHYAAWDGNVKLVRFLLWDSQDGQLGSVASVNMTDYDGYKPLGLANKRGHKFVIEELMALEKVSFWHHWNTMQSTYMNGGLYCL